MKKRTITALSLAAVLGLGTGTAVAVDASSETPDPAAVCLPEFMNDDQDAQWQQLQTWLEANYATQSSESSVDCATAEPTPDPTTEPTTEPSTEPTTTPAPEPTQEPSAPASGIETGEVKWTETGVTFEGKIAGTAPGDRVQIRTDTKELTGQRGFYEYELVRADGTVKFVLADYTTPQDKLFWHIAKGGSELNYGDVVATGTVSKPAAEPTPSPSAEPTAEPTTEPTTPPATGEGTTGGSGGPQSNLLRQSFTSNNLTSDYHIFASGLDYSKPVGLMMYADGSGGHGYDNPNQPYLLDADGTDGLVAIAKKHNMILVVPNAPGPGCDGYDNCWYDSNTTTVAQSKAKAKWSSDLMSKVKGQYNIDNARIVVGGYSSGAQWTSRYFVPGFGESQSVDLAVPIAYGGDPAGRTSTFPNFSTEYKNDLVLSWDTGTADEAYSTSAWGAIGGYNWYTNAGFTTDKLWVQGEDHSRDGQFDGIMDREIVQHLK